MTNCLKRVLLRFRVHPIAFMADIEAMFCNFRVPVEQRDYLRFYWYKDNDITQPFVPYRSTSHDFRLGSSPAVAGYGLRYCATGHTH